MRKAIDLILRYRVLHIVFWALMFNSVAHQLLVYKRGPLVWLNATTILITEIPPVYFIVEYLLPKLLLRRKYFLFSAVSLAAILCGSFMGIWIQEIIIRIFVNPEYRPRYFTVVIGSIIDTVIVAAGFIVVYLGWFYYKRDRNNKLAEHRQLEAELNFLRAQMNPHFVFNTLNSVYVLMDDDVPVARDTLLKFSSLLRYQLYDCSAKYSPLEKELEFIRDLIELETVRFGERVKVRFQYDEIPGDPQIAPLLLITFVENAFKHVSVIPGSNSYIHIAASYGDQFVFRVENTCDGTRKTKSAAGGIGLQNVRRRLELLYPGEHKLEILQQDGKFIVQLSMTLHEAAMPGGR